MRFASPSIESVRAAGRPRSCNPGCRKEDRPRTIRAATSSPEAASHAVPSAPLHLGTTTNGGPDGLRAALPGDGDTGREPGGRVLRRGHLDGDLLPARLSGPHAEARERALLPDRRGGPQRRIPGLSPVPPGRVPCQNPARNRSTLASSPAAIISRTEGTSSSATASWIFGAARAACSSMRLRCTAAQRRRLLSELIGQRRTVPPGALDDPAHRRDLPHRRPPSQRLQRLALGKPAGALGREHRELPGQRPLPPAELAQPGQRAAPGRRPDGE